MTRFWVSGGGGITSLKHLKGSPKGDAEVRVYLGTKPRSQLFYQVLLLEVSAKERDIVQVIPEENIYLKLALLVCLCSSG